MIDKKRPCVHYSKMLPLIYIKISCTPIQLDWCTTLGIHKSRIRKIETIVC